MSRCFLHTLDLQFSSCSCTFLFVLMIPGRSGTVPVSCSLCTSRVLVLPLLCGAVPLAPPTDIVAESAQLLSFRAHTQSDH
jgi:hypothetical protein